MNDYKWVGKRVQRKDGPEKVTGSLRYMTDYNYPNMVWGRVLRPKYPFARIKRIDTTRAKAYPGVVCVLTHEDIPGFNGFGIVIPDQPVLCHDVVRCMGDAVALVAAETEEIAELALELIEVDYEILTPVTDPEEAIKEESPSLHPSGNIHSRVQVNNGDVEKAFAEADVIVENTYYSPRQMHAFIETEGGWGMLEADGSLTIRCPGQYAFRDRLQIARVLAWNPSRIHVISNPIGGGFGGKDEITVQIYLALLALHTGGRPVKIHYKREESVIAGIKRHPFKVTMKTAAKRDGTLLANQVKAFADTGAYASLGGAVISLAIEHSCGPYYIPNVDLDGYCVYTNNGIAGAFRGFGVNQVCMAIEANLEMIAEKIGMDPIEIRKKNVYHQGGLSSMGNRVTSSVGTWRTLEEAEKCDLWKNQDQYKTPSEPWKKRGIGVASSFHGIGMGIGLPDYGAATIELLPGGRFKVGVCSEDIGQGNGTVFAIVAAEALHCHINDIDVVQGDTRRTIDSGTVSASRSTYVGGNSVLAAAPHMIQLLKETAAEIFQVPIDQVEYDQNKLRLAGASEGKSELTYADIYHYLYEHRRETKVEGHFMVPKADKQIGNNVGMPHKLYGYQTHVVMVEVDTLTGETEVLRVVSIPDCGKVINLQGLEGQTEGGAVMGIGYTLYEDTVIEGGYNKTTNFTNYILPTFKETPVIETIPVEELEDTGPFGAKGIGEVVMIPIIPAIMQAIYDATGARINHLPATPERVYKAMKEQGRI
ncbi:xanthine dehydrogenase family protein molybdopterin-binding subunit [Ammoniphilus sp. CFH 90114]|uniref:xanthine dehydrogenase family protein molybdopterin-binding subunit n=1 Tax=Ammoniphilus sp. CFH 90114 TaxID=2493665 RepID=UPI00100EEC45|nr:molybdopterin cofactor-binding domain-containing protein [Ammoniphilus sp. CFH 90114]RXT05765.1 xanthine dehydrogenase family protein molybdopterin-binding subunit [Ammoniphilus sp. CFH 90114]